MYYYTKKKPSKLRKYLLAILYIFFFQIFIYQPFKIPSTSMEPNLRIGDYLILDKSSYGFNLSSCLLYLNRLIKTKFMIHTSIVDRGDIVVFTSGFDDKIYYVKRVIGLPGDLIQIFDFTQIYINGKLVEREQVADIWCNQTELNTIHVETLPNGKSYVISLLTDYLQNFPHYVQHVYRIPSKCFFLMGDKRNKSIDSRLPEIGYIEEYKISGKVKMIFFNSYLNIKNLFVLSYLNRFFNIID